CSVPTPVFANPPKAGEALRIVINAMAQDFGRLGIGPNQSLSEIFSYYEITSSPPSGAPRDDGVGIYCR
ncbi:MAG: hypothetical protein WCV56_08680, partial [Candidatus Omnitrophota bacterium]